MELTARRLTDIYICLMLAAFPLWTGFEGYTGITRAKFLFFAALTGLWLAALALCALKYRSRLRRPRGFALCVLAFMAAACLSAAFSGNFHHALLGGNRYDGLVTLLLYGCIALGVSRWGQRLGLYVNLIALAAGLCALVCFLQLLRVNVLGLFPEGLDFYDAGTRYSGEFLGTIGNTNLLAGWFCLVIPLLTLSALRAKGVRRWLLLLPAAGCLALLIVIDAQSGLAGCLGCLLIVSPYYVNYAGRRKAALALGVAILALCIASFASVYLWPPEGGTLWELSEILHGRAQDGFGSSRVAIWPGGASALCGASAARRRAGQLRPALGAGLLPLRARDGADAHNARGQRSLRAAGLSREPRPSRLCGLGGADRRCAPALAARGWAGIRRGARLLPCTEPFRAGALPRGAYSLGIHGAYLLQN